MGGASSGGPLPLSSVRWRGGPPAGWSSGGGVLRASPLPFSLFFLVFFGGGPLHEAAQSRYLNYALSVITSRALPDVRDGLKPVQRRILYTMWQQNLTADAKHRKCAKVVGDVMGSYHPHGDAAIYDTLVRMAQPFSLRYPLVDGSGNFGSLDGDAAAAMRYTECRLARVSDELLAEIEQDDRSTSGRTTTARRPSRSSCRRASRTCWSTAATGIAVGMATNIPPHNLGEVCTALVKLLDNKDRQRAAVPLHQRTGLSDRRPDPQLARKSSRRSTRPARRLIRLRGTWDIGPDTRSTKTIYIDSVPTPSTRRSSSSGSARSCSAASCRSSSTSRTCRPTTSASRSS